MKILVTGGCGFVGRNLIQALLKAGHEVTCVDPIVEQTGGITPAQWPEFSPLDFKNFKYIAKDCREFFSSSEEHFDEVYHLAAMVGGRMMIEYNPLAVAEDLAIDAMMFVWAKRTNPTKLINFSSSASYPISLQKQNNYRLLKEEDISFESENIGLPDLTYGWAKLTAEFTGKIAYERHGIKSVVYRPFSGYGETQDLTYPFPSIVKRLREHRSGDFVVWGSGKQMRDFIHIEECVKCILQTKDQIDDGSAINISTGKLTSFIELAKLGLEILGKEKTEVRGLSDRPEGVFARGGDTTKQKSLGFSSEFDLRAGLTRALR